MQVNPAVLMDPMTLAARGLRVVPDLSVVQWRVRTEKEVGARPALTGREKTERGPASLGEAVQRGQAP